MNVRVMRIAVVTAVVVGGTTMTAQPVPVGAVGPCSATPTQTLTGAQATAFTTTLAPNERVDANAASWTGTTPYPVYFDSGDDSCWDGGTVKGTFPVSTTWNTFHGTTGFGFGGARFTAAHPRVFNYGDAISVRTGSDDFLVKDAYLSYIHDDCVQNDDLLAGTVDGSYLDGCYVAFSARRTSGTTFDGHLNTWNIKNSLVRLQAMPTVYKGSTAGHGGFFKWDDTALLSPKLNISNTVFRADQLTNHGDLLMPAGYDVTCSNNTMVWLGPGAFPGTLPSCFTITTDRSVWDAAVRGWKSTHPGVVTGPEVSVGDASIIEGTTGTRSIRFPLSLSAPPGVGNTVSVYWSTAPGTAGSKDFTPRKGKAVFTGNAVYQTVAVSVTPDSTPEQNELMYLVVSGVDGGQNHRERGTGTLVESPASTAVKLSVSDATLVEGNTGNRLLVVPVTLSNPATAAVTFTWSTVAGSAAPVTDYLTRSGTVTIPIGARMVLLTIPVVPDLVSEGTESFQVVVSGATNATMVDNTGLVTIRDDD